MVADKGNGEIVRSLKQLSKGELLELLFTDGKASCMVEELEDYHSGEEKTVI